MLHLHVCGEVGAGYVGETFHHQVVVRVVGCGGSIWSVIIPTRHHSSSSFFLEKSGGRHLASGSDFQLLKAILAIFSEFLPLLDSSVLIHPGHCSTLLGSCSLRGHKGRSPPTPFQTITFIAL